MLTSTARDDPVPDTETPPHSPGPGAFLRLWAVIAFSYALLKFAFNLVVMNAIDIRAYTIAELLVLPFGQTVVIWLIGRATRGTVTAARRGPAAAAPPPSPT